MLRHGTLMLLSVLILGAPSARGADEEVFSGPQVGEKLVGFKVLGAYDEQAGKEVDLVRAAGNKPLVLVFIHDPITRPSAAVTRAVAAYAEKHKDKLAAGVIMLKADKSEAEAFLKRARGSLQLNVPVGISPDGVEGPGAYGLNRNVSLTILVGKEGKVTANFALIQPSTTDGPKVLGEVAKVIGEKPPTQEEIDQLAYGGRRYAGKDQPRRGNVEIPRDLLVPVINKQATEEQLKAAVAKVEEYVAGNKERQHALGGIAARVVNGGKLENYGTPAAQEQLKKWAKEYGPAATDRPDRKDSR